MGHDYAAEEGGDDYVLDPAAGDDYAEAQGEDYSEPEVGKSQLPIFWEKSGNLLKIFTYIYFSIWLLMEKWKLFQTIKKYKYFLAT